MGVKKPLVFYITSSKTYGADQQILENLDSDVTKNHHECDVILLFCPVKSRTASDIYAAIKKLPDTRQPVVLVLMHHTYDPDHVLDKTQWRDTFSQINHEVRVLFHESENGLLNCSRNNQAIQELRDFIYKQGGPREKYSKRYDDTESSENREPDGIHPSEDTPSKGHRGHAGKDGLLVASAHGGRTSLSRNWQKHPDSLLMSPGRGAVGHEEVSTQCSVLPDSSRPTAPLPGLISTVNLDIKKPVKVFLISVHETYKTYQEIVQKLNLLEVTPTKDLQRCDAILILCPFQSWNGLCKIATMESKDKPVVRVLVHSPDEKLEDDCCSKKELDERNEVHVVADESDNRLTQDPKNDQAMEKLRALCDPFIQKPENQDTQDDSTDLCSTESNKSEKM
ncbi:hypothetical protein WMY93_007396 [Mugilogobius chulae]|uniref:Uncharacterized protein n=1 Tax=Mugilogobius chulae TaxID=88201 RepID=A0AAW0PEC7_9GOBI